MKSKKLPPFGGSFFEIEIETEIDGASLRWSCGKVSCERTGAV